MSPLLAPLLAQLVTLELGDRTEARYAGYNGDTRAEAATAPRIGVGVTRRRTSFGVAYAPSLTVSPLDRDPRELYVFHQAGAVAGHSFRRTTLGVAGSYAAGSRILNLAGVQGLLAPVAPTPDTGAAPTTPTTPTTPGVPTTPGAPGMPTTPGTPTTPGSGPTTAGAVSPSGRDQRIRYYTWTVSASASHRFSKELQLTGTAGTMTTKGDDDVSRYVVGSYRAYFIGGSGGYTYTKSRQDSFLTSLSLYKVWSSNQATTSVGSISDYEAATANASETWLHRFDDRTSTTLGAGMNVTRFSQDNGLAGISIYPTLQAGVSHRVRVNGGTLTLSANTYSAPVVDPLRATVDPRVGVGAVAIYARDKVTLTATTNAALSVAPNDRRGTAFNAAFAEGRAAYSLGKLTFVDAGARVARQTYGGQTVVPLSWAVFCALTFGASTTLVR